MQSENEIFINRRKFFYSLPVVFSYKIKRQIEVVVESRNNVEIFYLEEDTIKNIFDNLLIKFPFADVIEINYNKKERFLLKKYTNIVPLVFGVTIWTIQIWDKVNQTWENNGELFCFNF